jgi:hypothetical protein
MFSETISKTINLFPGAAGQVHSERVPGKSNISEMASFNTIAR